MDFSYYLRKIPGAYYFLGIANKQRRIVTSEHSSTRKIDESVLKYDTEILYRTAKKTDLPWLALAKAASLRLFNKFETDNDINRSAYTP